MKKLLVTLISLLFLFFIPRITAGEETEETDTSANAYLPAGIDVGNSGAFTYSVPVKLPGGADSRGLRLSLSYDSDSDNGILGKGWELTGLGTIIRDPAHSIAFENSDHYIYNGRKLVWVPEDTPGVINPGYFHTEEETFLRIKAYNLNSSSSYWTVTSKDGTIRYYGYSSGHIDAIGKQQKARVWALDKIEDVHKNTCIIDYFEAPDGSYYPVTITWTIHEECPIPQTRTVEFLYEKRPDRTEKYIPTPVKPDKRLVWIVVKVGGTLLRKYRIEYEQGSTTGQDM